MIVIEVFARGCEPRWRPHAGHKRHVMSQTRLSAPPLCRSLALLHAGGDPSRPISGPSLLPAPVDTPQTVPERFFHSSPAAPCRHSGRVAPVSRLQRMRRHPEIPIALDSRPPARLTATSCPGAFWTPAIRARGEIDAAGVQKPPQRGRRLSVADVRSAARRFEDPATAARTSRLSDSSPICDAKRRWS